MLMVQEKIGRDCYLLSPSIDVRHVDFVFMVHFIRTHIINMRHQEFGNIDVGLRMIVIEITLSCDAELARELMLPAQIQTSTVIFIAV